VIHMLNSVFSDKLVDDACPVADDISYRSLISPSEMATTTLKGSGQKVRDSLLNRPSGGRTEFHCWQMPLMGYVEALIALSSVLM
jgi:hypothetical protein